MATKKTTEDAPIVIPKIDLETVVLQVLGRTPLVLNQMSEKAKRQLLTGSSGEGKKFHTMKHDPPHEFWDSMLMLPKTPSLIGLPTVAFKSAMGTAALDIPGAQKTKVQRLVHVDGDNVCIYGIPKLFMRVVKIGGFNGVPDIRTRAILPTWACQIQVTYVRPMFSSQAIVNLLTYAGVTVGVGDARVEKGKFNYGQFSPVNTDDAEFLTVIAEGGRAQQLVAAKEPEFYDDESARLCDFWREWAKTAGNGHHHKTLPEVLEETEDLAEAEIVDA